MPIATSATALRIAGIAPIDQRCLTRRPVAPGPGIVPVAPIVAPIVAPFVADRRQRPAEPRGPRSHGHGLAALGLTLLLALAGPPAAGADVRAGDQWPGSDPGQSAVPAAAGLDADPSRPGPAAGAVYRDLAYGSAPGQSLDVYLPQRPTTPAPVIVLVHGGAWRFGDKGHSRVVDHKVDRWVSRGFVVVAINYPMLPATDVGAQAHHVARAVAHIQNQAARWGADAQRLILMGHSAGAHLVALINADPRPAMALGARPWLGAVALDSAALDVESIMDGPHFRLYDAAFGADRPTWRQLSPTRIVVAQAPPLLLVCSQRRVDSCTQARGYERRAQALGATATVLPVDLGHAAINGELGIPGPYTRSVEAFMAGLDPAVARLLSP